MDSGLQFTYYISQFSAILREYGWIHRVWGWAVSTPPPTPSGVQNQVGGGGGKFALKEWKLFFLIACGGLFHRKHQLSWGALDPSLVIQNPLNHLSRFVSNSWPPPPSGLHNTQTIPNSNGLFNLPDAMEFVVGVFIDILPPSLFPFYKRVL